MKVLITGADGFIGKNLQLCLAQRKDVQVVCFTREHDLADLPELLLDVEFVFHLAGVNRTKKAEDFVFGNQDLTRALAETVVNVAKMSGRLPAAFVFTSSTQGNNQSPYGLSKRATEEVLFSIANSHQIPLHIFRLPNVFGKWCKPDYNSAVATFCHNIARSLPIQINDAAALVTLVHVDDVIERLIQLMDGANASPDTDGFEMVGPRYTTTVGELALQIQSFKDSRVNLVTERVGAGFIRALYSTYVSYLPVESFAYPVEKHGDARGVFVEMLKTPDCGQFSFFTAHPGITRGGHYHHTKTEKFLVIKGHARFKFRHMHTRETFELHTDGETPQVVETVPGWTHDITNVGSEEMAVMLWANEIFDRTRPDTFACPV